MGNLDLYAHLPMEFKRTAVIVAVGSQLHWGVSEVQRAEQIPELRTYVDGVISAFETTHPSKVNEQELLGKYMKDMSSGLTIDPNDPIIAEALREQGIDPATAMGQTIGSFQMETDTAHQSPVGFSAAHMAHDGVKDAKVDEAFAEMIKDFETTEAKGKHRFIVGSDGETSE